MFLRNDNSIKWKWIAIAGAITAVLCVLGIVWLDESLFMFFRGFDWRIWHILDALFATKVWLFVSALALVFIYIKKTVKPKEKSAQKIKWFKFRELFRDFIVKTKNSSVFLIFCSVLCASLVGGVLKVIIGRARPIFFEALDFRGFFPLTTEWAFNSMPSGHTTASFAGLVMIGLMFPKWKWATWTLAIVIGVSRVCVGAHWASDVVLGAFIGMVIADLVKVAVRRA